MRPRAAPHPFRAARTRFGCVPRPLVSRPVWGTLGLLAVLGVVFWLTYTIGTPMQEWLDGLLGQFGEWVGSLITAWPLWLSDLIVDGIIGGAGMVVTFLPILLFFFATLGLLEDTGYMARAAYITDRYMHLMGLHGKSFMPLLLGFGCNVPSVLGARIIESKRARLLTIILSRHSRRPPTDQAGLETERPADQRAGSFPGPF